MAKHRSNTVREVEIFPSVTREQGIMLIRKQIGNGQSLLSNPPITSAVYQTWETVTRDYLVKIFGSLSPNVSSVMNVGRSGAIMPNAGEAYWERRRAESLGKQITVLEGLIELLETEITLSNPVAAAAKPSYEPSGNGAFLVHGRDTAAKESTARFLERLNVPVTILHEQANQGRTIIEKFIDHSNVAFAVVLLTGDDRGGLIDAEVAEQKPRARQNVIFELGFFIGKIGRKRVCALYEVGVEVPSDYDGVLFVPLDEHGAWKMTLAREMKAAGLEIDMNKTV